MCVCRGRVFFPKAQNGQRYLLLNVSQLPVLSPFKCESAKSERRYRVALKDFACRTAIKSVAPCRGDFCADIFSILSFVPHRGFKALALLLSLSLSLLSALAFFLSPALPSSRILALSLSICQFIFVSLFPSWRGLRHGQFRGHKVALHLRSERDAASACISTTHAKFSRLY